MRIRTLFLSRKIKCKIRNIKLIASDVDGVLTNGQLLYGNNLVAAKSFNVKDGLGTKELISNGIQIALISGGESGGMDSRAKSLSIKEYYSNVDNKSEKLKEIQRKINVSEMHTLYIGDDINDLDVLPNVALFVCTKDANYKVKRKSDIILRSKGGEGAFRELSDIILFLKSQ